MFCHSVSTIRNSFKQTAQPCRKDQNEAEDISGEKSPSGTESHFFGTRSDGFSLIVLQNLHFFRQKFAAWASHRRQIIRFHSIVPSKDWNRDFWTPIYLDVSSSTLLTQLPRSHANTCERSSSIYIVVKRHRELEFSFVRASLALSG